MSWKNAENSSAADHHLSGKSSSIILRLSLLYGAAGLAMLILSSFVLSVALKTNVDKAAERLMSQESETLKTIARRGGPEAVQEELALEFGHWPPGLYARIMDEDGRILGQSPGMEYITTPPIERAKAVYPAISEDDGNRRKVEKYGESSYLVMTSRAVTGPSQEGKKYLIQVAFNRADGYKVIGDYRKKLWAVLGAVIFAVSALAVVIARRELRPLADMTRFVGTMSTSRLHDRLAPRRWPGELAALAGALDNMLDHLEDSFNRLSQVSADIAHELRTPVNNLMGEAEVALSKSRTADEYAAVLESSVEELSRMSRLIESLLFLARAEKKDMKIERSLLRAADEIRSVVDFYRASAEERGVELTFRGDGIFTAERILFRRALSNLLSNALHHTAAGGTIEITVRMHDEESLEIVVSDNGSGISSEHLPYIFNRFFRGDNAASRGTGLGLAIVKSIMDLHGGAVDINSEYGRGTAVKLLFPLVSLDEDKNSQ